MPAARPWADSACRPPASAPRPGYEPRWVKRRAPPPPPPPGRRYWGKQNPARYVQHFSFNQSSWAENHMWRPEGGSDAAWRSVHVNDQAVEWQVFEFARQLDERGALYSISMGGPEVMGFNHASIGYSTPQEMFVAFQNVQNQLGAMFRFMEVNRLLDAIRGGDYVAFARSYNGPGNPEYYGGLIGSLVDVFRARPRASGRGACPAPTPPTAGPGAPRSRGGPRRGSRPWCRLGLRARHRTLPHPHRRRRAAQRTTIAQSIVPPLPIGRPGHQNAKWAAPRTILPSAPNSST